MPSGAGCLPRWNDFVSTSEPYPLYSALRGILGLEVNFTGYGYPRQKYLRGRLGRLVKFTFCGAPLQNALRGRLPSEVERLCIHLRALPPLQCPQRHIAFRGEFYRPPPLRRPSGAGWEPFSAKQKQMTIMKRKTNSQGSEQPPHKEGNDIKSHVIIWQ